MLFLRYIQCRYIALYSTYRYLNIILTTIKHLSDGNREMANKPLSIYLGVILLDTVI